MTKKRKTSSASHPKTRTNAWISDLIDELTSATTPETQRTRFEASCSDIGKQAAQKPLNTTDTRQQINSACLSSPTACILVCPQRVIEAVVYEGQLEFTLFDVRPTVTNSSASSKRTSTYLELKSEHRLSILAAATVFDSQYGGHLPYVLLRERTGLTLVQIHTLQQRANITCQQQVDNLPASATAVLLDGPVVAVQHEHRMTVWRRHSAAGAAPSWLMMTFDTLPPCVANVLACANTCVSLPSTQTVRLPLEGLGGQQSLAVCADLSPVGSAWSIRGLGNGMRDACAVCEVSPLGVVLQHAQAYGAWLPRGTLLSANSCGEVSVERRDDSPGFSGGLSSSMWNPSARLPAPAQHLLFVPQATQPGRQGILVALSKDLQCTATFLSYPAMTVVHRATHVVHVAPLLGPMRDAAQQLLDSGAAASLHVNSETGAGGEGAGRRDAARRGCGAMALLGVACVVEREGQDARDAKESRECVMGSVYEASCVEVGWSVGDGTHGLVFVGEQVSQESSVASTEDDEPQRQGLQGVVASLRKRLQQGCEQVERLERSYLKKCQLIASSHQLLAGMCVTWEGSCTSPQHGAGVLRSAELSCCGDGAGGLVVSCRAELLETAVAVSKWQLESGCHLLLLVDGVALTTEGSCSGSIAGAGVGAPLMTLWTRVSALQLLTAGLLRDGHAVTAHVYILLPPCIANPHSSHSVRVQHVGPVTLGPCGPPCARLHSPSPSSQAPRAVYSGLGRQPAQVAAHKGCPPPCDTQGAGEPHGDASCAAMAVPEVAPQDVDAAEAAHSCGVCQLPDGTAVAVDDQSRLAVEASGMGCSSQSVPRSAVNVAEPAGRRRDAAPTGTSSQQQHAPDPKGDRQASLQDGTGVQYTEPSRWLLQCKAEASVTAVLALLCHALEPGANPFTLPEGNAAPGDAPGASRHGLQLEFSPSCAMAGLRAAKLKVWVLTPTLAELELWPPSWSALSAAEAALCAVMHRLTEVVTFEPSLLCEHGAQQLGHAVRAVADELEMTIEWMEAELRALTAPQAVGTCLEGALEAAGSYLRDEAGCASGAEHRDCLLAAQLRTNELLMGM